MDKNEAKARKSFYKERGKSSEDRLNDKIFSYNNLLIGGFFALGQFNSQTPSWTIIFPLVNCAIIIFIDIKYLIFNVNEVGRAEDDNSEKNFNHVDHVFNLSLVSIISTLIVTIVFVFYLI